MRPILSVLLLCAAAWGQKTDLGTYAVPSPSACLTGGAAGTACTDPVFQTLVIRITDATNCPHADGCYHDYSYTDVFTRNNLRLVVGSPGTRYWFDFNPAPTPPVLGARHTFPDTPAPDNFVVQGDFVTVWDPTDETGRRTFVYDGAHFKIWSLDVVTGASSYTLVKQFSVPAELPAGTTSFNLTGNSVSRDGDVFSFTFGLAVDGTSLGCFAWRRSTDTILHLYTGDEANECQNDKSGEYMVRKANTNSLVSPITNLLTGVTTTVTQCPPSGVGGTPTDWSMYHSDFGTRFAVTVNGLYNDCFGSSGQRFRINMSNLHVTTPLTPYGLVTGAEGHISMRGDDDQWAVFEFYRTPPIIPGLFAEEVFAAATDGSFRVQRYAHHQSATGAPAGYRAQPKATASRDLSLITFDSNNGNPAGRTDVFVVVVARRSATPASVGMTVF